MCKYCEAAIEVGVENKLLLSEDGWYMRLRTTDTGMRLQVSKSDSFDKIEVEKELQYCPACGRNRAEPSYRDKYDRNRW